MKRDVVGLPAGQGVPGTMPLWRRILFGRPLATHQSHHQRLPKYVALPVFSSDAISSVAYATDEILLALVLAGVATGAALNSVFPISFAIALLLVIVVFSYQQTIHAYPNGGGSYIVAKDNLGTVPGLTAGAALLIDYVLTVSVSVAAGVAAIVSAFPSLNGHEVGLSLAFILLLTVANLRGLKESGTLFMIPTYGFLFCLYSLIAVGLFKYFTGSLGHNPGLVAAAPTHAATPLALFLVLKGFSSGCSAMTGTEAVSNGVPAFQAPESRNAGITLWWMGGILGSLFLGVSFLAWHYGAIPREGQAETVLSLLANGVFGRSWFFYAIQFTTCAILVVAANTSYADFPRLTMLLAQDRFLPRQFANIGDRLVFTNGILVLALLASALIVGFGGSTHALIPLYAVGVFLSFTLSQAGMVVRWFRLKERGWQRNSLINGFGALCTAVVTGVIGYTKFTAGEPVKLFPLTTPLGLWVVLTAAAFVLVSMYRRSMARGVLVLSSLLFLGWWAATGAVGHTRVTTFDLKDPSVLAARLHASREPVSQYLSAHLSPETRELLDRFDGFGVPSDALQAGLAGDLDRLVRGPSLYDPDRFSGVRLRRDTRRLLAEPTPGAALARLNRNLLEDAYPRVLEHTRGVLHTSEVHLGAWVVILIIPILVWMFSRIHAHYHEVASHLTMEKYRPVGKFRHTVLVSVSGVHRGIMPALEYARSIGDDVRAVYVELDPSCTPGVQERWAKWVSDIPLIILDSPFRALTEPLLTYIDEVERERDDDVVTIIIPEFVTEKWWTALLHGQQGMMLKWALLFKKGIVVVNVRYHLDDTVDDDLGLHPLTSAGDREATLR